ncbi:hypothetical protein, partial [Methylobacterium soli]|uniref:hypothetical protein n=1 Tax=Methylobacterium soli TaxID=553447 RepID=UPI001EE2CB20
MAHDDVRFKEESRPRFTRSLCLGDSRPREGFVRSATAAIALMRLRLMTMKGLSRPGCRPPP